MKNIKILMVYVMCLFGMQSIFAQSDDATTASPEQSQASSKFEILWTQVAGSTRDAKELVLRLYETEKIAMDADGIKLMGYLAGAGTAHPDQSSPNNLADLRMRAIDVLQKGGADAKQPILTVLPFESDPNTMGAAFYVLSQISDMDAAVLGSMNHAMKRLSITAPSDSAADEYLNAVASSATAKTDTDTLNVLLMLLNNNGYSQKTRKQAQKVLLDLLA
jgi:hypothetical protein